MQQPSQSIKNELVALAGEYIGTTSFLSMGFAAAQIANLPGASATGASGFPSVDTSNLIFIATAFGLSLLVNAWVFYRVSGSIFNPAVTLSLAILGAVPPLRAALVVVAQILGGITAAALVDGLTPGPLLVATGLGPGVSIARGLFIEMFLTAELILAILMLAVEKHKATFVAPVGIGLALFICHLAGIYYTGASMNPARSFGPQVVIHDFPGYHWIYWVGPGLGALLASAIYKILKLLDYEQNNGSQDRDDTMQIVRLIKGIEGSSFSRDTFSQKDHVGEIIVSEVDPKSKEVGGATV